jgi:hypothetical protein
LLLYNGDDHWQAATDLSTLIALPHHTPLWSYQPGMRYYLIDESRYPEGKPGSLSGFVMRLENARLPQDFLTALEELSQAVSGHLDSLRRALAVWITYVMAPHRGIELNPEDTENLDEVKAMLATRVEQWEQAIRQESLEKGWKGGREEGRKTGEATMLCKMLELKYGPLPQWALDKVSQADAATLEQWAAKLLDAQTLEAVFDSET